MIDFSLISAKPDKESDHDECEKHDIATDTITSIIKHCLHITDHWANHLFALRETHIQVFLYFLTLLQLSTHIAR